MPNYLRLTNRETGVAHESRGLIEVDEKLCAALGVPCDDNSFYLGWVDWDILYMKNDWDEVRAFYRNIKFTPEEDKRFDTRAWLLKRLEVIDWLAEHYSLDGYAMIGRR